MSDQCRAWIASLRSSGATIVIPEIADYEIRRELLQRVASARIRQLDALKSTLGYLPITTQAIQRAADFWAQVRRVGLPTPGPKWLDADAILAGQADTVGLPGDRVTIATGNAKHLARFSGIDARQWDSIH